MAAPTITWSELDEGTAISEPLDNGSKENGQTTDALDIYIRHDASNQLTACKFWVGQYSGDYLGDGGSTTAAQDIAEILAWGDGAIEEQFGGFMINMDDGLTWPTVGDKNTAQYGVFRTGVGDSAENGITLAKEMSTTMSQDGVIPADGSHVPNPHFQCKIHIPLVEDTAGIRLFDQKLRFTYTS